MQRIRGNEMFLVGYVRGRYDTIWKCRGEQLQAVCTKSAKSYFPDTEMYFLIFHTSYTAPRILCCVCASERSIWAVLSLFELFHARST